MRSLKAIHRDYYGSVLVLFMGLGAVWQGAEYDFGNLQHMGSGFIPVVLGSLLLLVGVAMATTTSLPRRGTPVVVDDHGTGPFHVRGWGCILGGVLAFVVLGDYGGLVPATFFAVFIAAMGDRNNTWLSAGALAGVLTIGGTALFKFALGVQLPLFAWAS